MPVGEERAVLHHIEHIRDELLYLRTRLDSHVEENVASNKCLQKQVSALREETTKNNVEQHTKMKGMITGISTIISTVVAVILIWISSKFN